MPRNSTKLYVHEFGFGFERAETELVVGVDNIQKRNKRK
jgi:hypothetical protein